MGRPQSNGVVELVDERSGMDGSWNCMDFHLFSFDEEDKSWEAFHTRFLQAKSGNCPYQDKCLRYARTMAKRNNEPIQLKFF